jgi:heptaprenyl diphosphate synthase
MISTRKIAVCGLMTAIAMIFSYIESLIPIPLPVPGIKLGIANMAIIVVLFIIGISEAVIVDILRVVLTAALFGNFNSFMFSISGAVLSILVMSLLKKTDKFSEVGISVAGGVMHNVGQTIAAVFIMQTSAIAFYLPVLMISGIVTGIIIGIVASVIIKSVVKAWHKWDPDYTKLTPLERRELEKAQQEIDEGKTVSGSDIKW